MTDPFVPDEVLEAVLRSRAGDGAPRELHGQILAAVAADGPRATVRRSPRHPWRLLSVAAVLLGTMGTALFVGGQRAAEVTPTPPPSHLAVTPTRSRSPVPSGDTTAVVAPATLAPASVPTASPCTAHKYVVRAGQARLLDAPGLNLPPQTFGTVAGVDWGTATEKKSWGVYVGDAKTPFAQAAYGTGPGLGSVIGSSADHSLLLVSVSVARGLGEEGLCAGLYVVRSDGTSVIALRDGTAGPSDVEAAMSPSGLVAVLERDGSAGPTLSVTDALGRVRSDRLNPCQGSFDITGGHLLSWSPDSLRVAIRCAPGEIEIVRPGDGSIGRVGGVDPWATSTGMTWTPDGRLLLAEIAGSKLTFDAADPTTNAIVSTTRADRSAPWEVDLGARFSPGGRWLVVATGGPPYDAYFVDPRTGITHEVADCADGAADCMWASDSTITLPTDTPVLVSVPDRRVIAKWGGFSFFTLLP